MSILFQTAPAGYISVWMSGYYLDNSKNLSSAKHNNKDKPISKVHYFIIMVEYNIVTIICENITYTEL